jgi:FkbH-like protein
MTLTTTTPKLEQLDEAQKRALLANLLQKARQIPVLSVAQERIWQLDQLSPGNPVYNFQGAVSLEGILDHPALQRAVTHIVARHDTLRTGYGTTHGKPSITIAPAPAITIEHIDWRTLNAEQQEDELQSAATAAAQTRFDLSSPPLFRLQCFRMSDTRHVLVLTMHHIVSDLFSLDLFFEELGVRYGIEIGSQAEAGDLPALSWTYQDHARASQSGRNGPPNQASIEFWRKLLTDAPDVAWHSDFPRPAKSSGKAATIHLTIEANTVAQVEALARQERVTPFVVLLTAFFLLQRAASDQDNQLIGIPSSGRDRQETASLIGMFSTPLPMRVDLAQATTVRALLQLVRQTVLGVTEHAELPLTDIVEVARTASGGRSLTLRSMFSFVSRMRQLVFPGMTLERVLTDRCMSDFDLFLTLYRDGDRWRGIFEYSTDLFSAQTAQGWADAYGAIVRDLAARLDAKPADIFADIPKPRALQIAIAATFTADTLADAAAFWQQQLRWPVKITFSPYNQIFQTLLDSSSEFHQPNTLNALLVRPEDWVRYTDDSARRHEMLVQIANEFVDTVRQVRLKSPLVIYLCPRSPKTPNGDTISRAESIIEDNLSGTAGVTVLRASTVLARYGLTDFHDPQSDDIGHIPFTSPWFVAMGTELMRRASSLQRPPYKVIALDCDNTLWRGVCGEEGAQGVSIDGPFRTLQQFVAAQAAAGMLLCLVSKNEEEDVFRVFDENADMVLSRERIAGHRVNWLPKSANLRSLAAELQLGLDSFIFIDDNPVECAEVRAVCPEVLTLCLPAETDAIPAFLDNVWAFDRHEVSAEDRKRADSYLQNRQRETLRHESGSFTSFLEQLDLRIDLVPVDDENLSRVAQLSQRTNQFNNTGIRYDTAELRHALANGLCAVAVSVRDRFGDYGLVGTVTYRTAENALLIEGFMLSCRVLGRGVEHRMLAEMGHVARDRGLDRILLHYKELPRNQPFRRFTASLDGHWNESGNCFCLTVNAALTTRFNPEQQTAEGNETITSTSSNAESGVHRARQIALSEIADSLRSLNDVIARIKQSSQRRHQGEALTPPQGETELAIAAIWHDVLQIDALGRDDNFFEVGGNSLLIVQVNGMLIKRFGQDIAITTLFQYPTISSLAQYLANGHDRTSGKALVQERATQARQRLQQRMQRLSDMRRQ